MSSPLQFYHAFRVLLAASGIRQVLTSGMACVEYGILQATKDTDWVIHPEDLATLELERLHAQFDRPHDLSLWPAELDGGLDRP